MKKWQIWYVCLGALFLLSGVVGCLLLHFAPDAGLAGVKSVANLARLPVRLVWAQGDVVEGNETAALALEDLTGNQQQYVQEMLAADLAVLATATGELDITSSTLGRTGASGERLGCREHVHGLAGVWPAGDRWGNRIQQCSEPDAAGKTVLNFLDGSVLEPGFG